MGRNRVEANDLSRAVRKWAFLAEFGQVEQGKGLHHEMAVYVLADRALRGEYGDPPDFRRLNSEIPNVAGEIEASKDDERIGFYANAWVTMTRMLDEAGIGPYGIRAT